MSEKFLAVMEKLGQLSEKPLPLSDNRLHLSDNASTPIPQLTEFPPLLDYSVN